MASLLMSFMIMGINIGSHLIENWKNEVIKSAQLSQAAMEAELQALKLQIDPHFVFNNLSVLSELILENQEIGYKYAENFSKIYRFLLVNSKKNIITLEEELKFLKSYIFLIEQRIGDGVQFLINIDKELKFLQLPPFTLQLLIENALKHNKTNKKEPLIIKIYSNEKQEIIVENNILPIEHPINSSGIGIKNIIRRYNLLSDKEPKTILENQIFKIEIPLLTL